MFTLLKPGNQDPVGVAQPVAHTQAQTNLNAAAVAAPKARVAPVVAEVSQAAHQVMPPTAPVPEDKLRALLDRRNALKKPAENLEAADAALASARTKAENVAWGLARELVEGGVIAPQFQRNINECDALLKDPKWLTPDTDEEDNYPAVKELCKVVTLDSCNYCRNMAALIEEARGEWLILAQGHLIEHESDAELAKIAAKLKLTGKLYQFRQAMQALQDAKQQLDAFKANEGKPLGEFHRLNFKINYDEARAFDDVAFKALNSLKLCVRRAPSSRAWIESLPERADEVREALRYIDSFVEACGCRQLGQDDLPAPPPADPARIFEPPQLHLGKASAESYQQFLMGTIAALRSSIYSAARHSGSGSGRMVALAPIPQLVADLKAALDYLPLYQQACLLIAPLEPPKPPPREGRPRVRQHRFGGEIKID